MASRFFVSIEDIVSPKYFVNIMHHIWESLTYPFNAHYYNSHEYNLYVSYLGVLLIGGSLVALIVKYKPLMKGLIKQYRFMLGAFLVFLLAIGPFHQAIIKLLQSVRYFNPIDAVPSRFMFYPFNLMVLLASLGFDEMFRFFPERVRNVVKGSALFTLLMLLMIHSYDWWMFHSQVYSIGEWAPKVFKAVIYDNVDDSFYKSVVNYSYLSSILILSCAGVIYLRLRKKCLESLA